MANGLSFSGGPAFGYVGTSLAGMTFDAGSGGSNTANVTEEIPGGDTGTVLALVMGPGAGNQVALGDPTHAAFGLGSVAITGSTRLTIDDSADASARTVDVTSVRVDFGVSGPTFHDIGATSRA